MDFEEWLADRFDEGREEEISLFDREGLEEEYNQYLYFGEK